MQGRAEFTQTELDEIRRLLREKNGASVSKQKHLRHQLRDMGFYATDFGYQGHGFREADLDRLLTKGQVRVADGDGDQRGPVGRLGQALKRWWA